MYSNDHVPVFLVIQCLLYSPAHEANKELLVLFAVDGVGRGYKLFQGHLEGHQLLTGLVQQPEHVNQESVV